MNMLQKLKQKFRTVYALQRTWGAYRRWELHRDYDLRREYYSRLSSERALTYDEAKIGSAVTSRLRTRGYTPKRRKVGEIHTFAFIPRLGWHSALYPDISGLGPVSEYDYVKGGYSWTEFGLRNAMALRRRREMNQKALTTVKEAHRRRPIDWMFVYASGTEIKSDLIQAIIDEIGAPVVNMCLDDKQSWTGPRFDGRRVGQVDIASVFDLSWTSARVACEWYLVEGGRPLYLPEGFDPNNYRPMQLKKDIPVSFIGGAYGFRPAVIRYLRKRNIPISVYGPDWKTESVWGDKQIEIINRSTINLGMGGIAYSEDLTNVKTRDFEIPGTGGGMYLTSYNSDLALHFEIGKEIVCYRSRDEMLELIRYYLSHPDEAMQIANRARERCMREHRWLHRYQRICHVLGILES